MNFLNPYFRKEYIDFFQNKLLTDDFRLIEEKLPLEFKPQYLKKVELIGKDKSLELEVYEILHESENDPRVGLSKDIFRLMSKFNSKRALVILHSTNSKNYRLSLATVDLSLEGAKVKREYSNPRRYSFFLGPDTKVHTPYDFLIKQGRVKDFEDLQNRFSIEVVNKEFYKEIANWYFWALKKVQFPNDVEAEKNGREISVIRLITRLIFIWFMKVRKLIPEVLFEEISLKEILTDLNIHNDNFYKAILQNLFFATLNTKKADRRFTSKKRGYKGYSIDFGNHNVYRYEELFNESEEVIEKYFIPIPFLNGGLFECLDYKSKNRDIRKYIDGFTSTKSQQPNVPNILFFGEDKLVDLNKDYGTTNKNYSVRGLIKTLSLYNFTIDENDPNDADVALDPELLGKVFENLLASYNPDTSKTARKSTGSYYTPRPIVDYMVDESLKQYFIIHFKTDDFEDKLNLLFLNDNQSNPFNTTITKKLVTLIDSLRAVDPAVGSGAFPMRILNRLVFLLHKLDPDNTLWKESQIEGIKKSVKDPILQRKFLEETERKFREKNPNYGRKLYLIQKCIYGVDIQQIAVEIAKLRFFISLLVDEKIDNGEIEPLPNLDFKLIQGNSLISSFAGIDFNTKSQNEDNLFDLDSRYRELIENFEELKSQFQNEPDVQKKNELRNQIDNKLSEIFEEKLKQHFPQLNELENKYEVRKEILEAEKKKLFKKIGIDLDQAKQDLVSYTEGRKQKDFFLWDVYFAEVFAEKEGFDIVIGNPPYVRQESIDSNLKMLLKSQHPQVANGTADLYVYFFNTSFGIINPNGSIIFITLNKYLKTKYGLELRKRMFDNFSVLLIIDFFEQPVFEAATDSAISLIINKDKDCITKYFPVKSLVNLNLNEMTRGSYYQTVMNDKEWIFIEGADENTLNKMSNNSVPLKSFVKDKIYRGITTGLNKAFVLDDGNAKMMLSSESRHLIKKYAKSTDIKRWQILKKDSYFLATGFDIDIKNKYPTAYKYLKGFESELTIRQDKGRHWYNLRACSYYDEFEKTKIIYMHTARKHEFYFDFEGRFINNSCYMIISEDKYLFCFLNSKLFDWFKRIKFVAYGDAEEAGRVKLDYNKMITVPIPIISPKQHQKFVEIVDKIITIKKQSPSKEIKHLEDKIDLMIYKICNLTYEEIKAIDSEIDKIISLEDYNKIDL